MKKEATEKFLRQDFPRLLYSEETGNDVIMTLLECGGAALPISRLKFLMVNAYDVPIKKDAFAVSMKRREFVNIITINVELLEWTQISSVFILFDILEDKIIDRRYYLVEEAEGGSLCTCIEKDGISKTYWGILDFKEDVEDCILDNYLWLTEV